MRLKMSIHELSFCKAIILNPDLAEIIVDDGIEIDLEMMTEYHNWVSENLSNPCMILTNKINSYTYSFDAQLIFGSLEQIKAVAVLAHCNTAITTTEYLTTVPRENSWNVKIFSIRNEALLWLEKQWVHILDKN